MTFHLINRAVAAAFASLLSATVLSSARAEIQDYEFQLVDASPKVGAAVIEARLVNKKTGKNIPDAVISASRIDMAPDGMEAMTSRIEQTPSAEPGVYRFRTNLTMEGGWRLSLAAKVQGETGTVESRLVLRAIR
ncbi:FixH family protein [Terrarubrum flagellatum]|uniref:FixH family protein n=1 Tax=Terrirubrum flagellatum TaxID=2895980 RepID=UPI00314502B0